MIQSPTVLVELNCVEILKVELPSRFLNLKCGNLKKSFTNDLFRCIFCFFSFWFEVIVWKENLVPHKHTRALFFRLTFWLYVHKVWGLKNTWYSVIQIFNIFFPHLYAILFKLLTLLHYFDHFFFIFLQKIHSILFNNDTVLFEQTGAY
jgi:hypothetical protein